LPVGNNLGGDIEAAGIYQRGDPLRRQGAAPFERTDGIGDRLARRLPVRYPLNGLAPPLQADGAELGLAHLLGDTGKLDIEGIEREKIGARLTWREQGGKSAIGIA